MAIALTFDDISIIPWHSEILPSESCVKSNLTRNIVLNTPLISAAMDTVTEAAMAIAMAQEGGIGIIHKNLSVYQQVDQVKRVKRFEGGMVSDPVTVTPFLTMADVKRLIEKTGVSSFPVVIQTNQGTNSFEGMLTARDIKFTRCDDVLVRDVMTPAGKTIMADEKMSRESMIELMYKNKVERLPVIRRRDDATSCLVGLITLKDCQLLQQYPLSSRDQAGKLLVGAATGVGDSGFDRAEALIESGVDVIVVDTAHGHSQAVINMVYRMKRAYPGVELIAGNIVTSEAASQLVDAGADAVKVGIGPGCFVPGTKITTQSGIAPIEEVEEGTKVLTHRGRWKKVVGKSTFFDKKEVTSINGIKSTIDHEYYVIHKRHRSSVTDENLHQLAEWIKAKDLTKEYLLIKPKG